MRGLTPFWPQWLAASEMFLLSLMVGINVGWTSPFMGKLSRPDPPFEVTKEETTWIVSLVAFSRPIGILIGTTTGSLLGVKQSAYMCGLSFLIGSICLILADSIKIVFGYFICSGIGFGILECTNPVFIGEIADPKIRGGLASYVIQGLMVGSVLGNVTGSFLDLPRFAWMNLAISLFFLTTFYFCPHTPHYLVRRGCREEAVKSIEWYNRTVDARRELEGLSKFLMANPPLPFSETLRKMNTPVNRKIVSLVIGVVVLEKLTGIMTIRMYLEILFTEGRVTVTSPAVMVIIMTVLSVFACWISMYVLNKIERRTAMLGACTALSIAFVCWGLDYQLLDLGYDNPSLQWLVISAAVLYRLSVCIAMYPMSAILMSELFAPDIKNMAVCIATVFCSVSAFLSSKYFQFMVDELTYKYVFYTFAGCTVLLGIYCYYLLPKTKGKSLQEIQLMLNNEYSEELETLKV